MSKYEEAMKNLEEKFGGKESLITLATLARVPNAEGKPRPDARIVNAYYEDGSFYIATHAKSNKMQQIADNPEVAVCYIVETFTASAIGEDAGWVADEKNAAIMEKVRKAFAEWYPNVVNEADQNQRLLRVRMTKGLWHDAHTGDKNEIDFVNKTAT